MMLAPYAKAVIAALLAGLGSLQVALEGDGAVSNNEWIIIATAIVAALGLVWGVPNTPKQTQEDSVERPSSGGAYPGTTQQCGSVGEGLPRG